MGERSATSEPHRSCYVSRARNEARVQRGRSEVKKSFFYPYYSFAERFFIILENLIFFISIFSRGAGGELKK